MTKLSVSCIVRGRCYGLALLPLIICLGRLCIASKYIFSLWQLHQGVDSLAQWLEHWIFIRDDRVRIPWQAGNFFSYASFLSYNFNVVRWGLVRNRTLFHQKWLHSPFVNNRSRSGCKATHWFILQYRIQPNYRTYPYYHTIKQFHSLQITASVLCLLLYKDIWCGCPFEVHRLVDAIEMSTLNICNYKENKKKIT